MDFPSTSVSFFKTNLVAMSPTYKTVTGLTALLIYIFGEDGLISVVLKAKGDTAIGDGRYQNVLCNVVQNPPISVADPEGLIAGWVSYRAKWIASLPPDTVMRMRYIDAASGVS